VISSNGKRIEPLLMLCPLLAVSDSVINALGLSIVAMLVALTASLPTSLALQRLPEYGRIGAVVVIAAGVVTSAMLVIDAWFYELYLAVGTYLPLLVAGGLLLSRQDVATPRARQSALVAAGLRTGLKFSLALLLLGAAREWVGHGSLLSGAQTLPGSVMEKLSLQVFNPEYGFVLALLPPGAFIAIGLLFAIRNRYWTARHWTAQ
jgi:Na+-translocating ferredoxin:NAD+ oxidoreductase subunit E